MYYICTIIKFIEMGEFNNKELIDLIQKSQTQPTVLDVSYKILGVLLFGLVSWIAITTLTLKTEFVEIKKDIEYIKQTNTEFETFAKQPIFTQDDYRFSILPLEKKIDEIIVTLQTNASFDRIIEGKLREIETRVQLLEAKKK